MPESFPAPCTNCGVESENLTAADIPSAILPRIIDREALCPRCLGRAIALYGQRVLDLRHITPARERAPDPLELPPPSSR